MHSPESLIEMFSANQKEELNFYPKLDLLTRIKIKAKTSNEKVMSKLCIAVGLILAYWQEEDIFNL